MEVAIESTRLSPAPPPPSSLLPGAISFRHSPLRHGPPVACGVLTEAILCVIVFVFAANDDDEDGEDEDVDEDDEACVAQIQLEPLIHVRPPPVHPSSWPCLFVLLLGKFICRHHRSDSYCLT